MQTEGKITIKPRNIKPREITFHTKDKGIPLYLESSIQRRFPGHDIIHITEKRMSFIATDTINQHFLCFLAVDSL